MVPFGFVAWLSIHRLDRSVYLNILTFNGALFSHSSEHLLHQTKLVHLLAYGSVKMGA